MIGDINTESVIKKLIIVQSYRPLFFTWMQPLKSLIFNPEGGMDDDQVKAVLKQAFLAVEKEFFDSIGDELVEKTLLQEAIAVCKKSSLTVSVCN